MLHLSVQSLFVLLASCFVLAQRCDPLKETTLSRVYILTDISNEPDDQESLVRLLVHSDLYNITGITAATSYWLNDTTYPDHILQVVGNYSLVYSNLQAHSTGKFVDPNWLSNRTFSGPLSYGLAALGEPLANGTAHLISEVDSSDQPLYVQAWSGVNTLAQALNHVRISRGSEELESFTSKLRVYTISDQDNAGFWIRANFPQIQYISSLHGWNYYNLATWTGISGEKYYSFDNGGPDSSLVSDGWLAQHIQVGPLGMASYLTPEFIMEGDSPSLLYTVANGLNAPEHPEFGGWGGRYTAADLSRMSGNHFADAVDFVIGVDGRQFVSSQATIWRWREAYQAEFAARMQWTLTSNLSTPNIQHPPVAIVNGSCGFDPYIIEVDPSQTIILDGSSSFSPDNEPITFNWTHYREPSLSQSNELDVPQIPITCLDKKCQVVELTVLNSTIACTQPVSLHQSPANIECRDYHILLNVRNDRTLGMSRYKRVILSVRRLANTTGIEMRSDVKWARRCR